jgi:hypothetical protein
MALIYKADYLSPGILMRRCLEIHAQTNKHKRAKYLWIPWPEHEVSKVRVLGTWFLLLLACSSQWSWKHIKSQCNWWNKLDSKCIYKIIFFLSRITETNTNGWPKIGSIFKVWTMYDRQTDFAAISNLAVSWKM